MKSKVFDFRRTVRTSDSEHFLVFDGDVLAARVSAHFGKSTYMMVVLLKSFSESDQENLMDQLHHFDHIDDEDLMFDVIQGKELGFYSGIKDWSDEPPSRQEVEKLFNKIVGRDANLRGNLTELVLKVFFEEQNYQCALGNNKDDSAKIDLIARNSTQILFIQSKSQGIDKIKTLQIYLETMQKRVQIAYKDDSILQSFYVFVGHVFPTDIDFKRQQLEESLGVKIVIIRWADIFRRHPKYKEALSGKGIGQ